MGQEIVNKTEPLFGTSLDSNVFLGFCNTVRVSGGSSYWDPLNWPWQ